MVVLSLEVFIGTKQWINNSSIKPERAGTFRIYYDNQKSKYILDSENHSYCRLNYGTGNYYTWGHFEEYSGDFDSEMVFVYVKNLQTDISTYNVKLIPYSAIQTRNKMYVPALYGNLYITNNQNSENSKCGRNSIPKHTEWYNPLQDRENRTYYISVQPQSYTILF